MMKQLFKKPWFLGSLIIALMSSVFVLNLVVLFTNLKGTYNQYNFWTLSRTYESLDPMAIFALVMVILFYGSILPLILTILALIRKRRKVILASIGYFVVYISTFIVVQTMTDYISNLGLNLLFISLGLLVIVTLLHIVRTKVFNLKIENRVESIDNNKPTKIPRRILIMDIFSILVVITTFFIPVYTVPGSNPYHAILIGALFMGDTNLEVILFFLANFAILLGIFLYFSDVLSHYFFDIERFVKKSRFLINLLFVMSLVFFIVGLILNFYYTLEGVEVQTISYIPLGLMVAVIFIFAILKGKYNIDHPFERKKFQIRYAKHETLWYVFLITAVSVLLLFIPIVVITITYGTYEYTVNLTGLKILTDYPVLDPGYRLVAYVLVVMLITSGMGLVLTITSYLSNSKQFPGIVKFTTLANVFFIFIISISGYYFQIAQEINKAIMNDIFEFYGILLPGGLEYEYKIGTNAILALLIAIPIVSVMFFRKAFERMDLGMIGAVEVPPVENPLENETKPDEIKPEDKEKPLDTTETVLDFDPAPAFTELDKQIDAYKEDLEIRKNALAKGSSLKDLVNFVVEYARNSRLHLSYTPQDIATFVAGMGAAKLSILQGMSGTGKTSLPKIFAEAIYANCDIIEVESSWKDKNELLGYYNEFSMKYTPKKFTLALYKAALNPDIFTFILLDEMNLSRIEYYFSDFLSLMEHEENNREIKLINIPLYRTLNNEVIPYQALTNGHTLKVPKNIWFIGTANRDESTFVISDKVYDRAHTMNFTKRAPKVRNYKDPMSKQYYDQATIQGFFDEAKAKGDFDAETNETIKKVEELLAPYNISFGNRILKQIEDFVNIYKACFKGEDVEAEAVEKILLSKVVAKLETKTLDDKEKLEQDFLKLKLNQCAAFIKRLDND